MERQMVKHFTLRMVTACVFVCIVLVYLPQINSWANGQIAHYKAMRKEAQMREEMSALELMRVHEQEIGNTIRDKLGDSIRMAYIGEGRLKEITITEEVMKRKTTILFPGLKEDSLNQYPIIGSTRHLKDMKVEEVKEGLSVSFVTDVVVEPVLTKEKGFCYVNLKEPREVYDKIVVVDAGHGGKMPGAVINGVKEKNINLKIVRALKEILDKEKGVRVYYTRLDDRHVELEERVGLANEVKADIFISIHQNAIGNRFNGVSGTQVLYSEGGDNAKDSKKLAKIMLTHTLKGFRSPDKGVIKGDGIHIIRNAKMPVALVEVGFLTSAADQKKLNNEKNQKKIAKALYDGIMEALELGL